MGYNHRGEMGGNGGGSKIFQTNYFCVQLVAGQFILSAVLFIKTLVTDFTLDNFRSSGSPQKKKIRLPNMVN